MGRSQESGGRDTSNTIPGLVFGNVVQAGSIHINRQLPPAPVLAVEGRVWNVPARNPNFTGRSKALEQLRVAMHTSGTVAVQSLRGMGGVGKTQLATDRQGASGRRAAHVIRNLACTLMRDGQPAEAKLLHERAYGTPLSGGD